MTTDPSSSVVHLTMRRGKHPLAVGSGVLYERNGQHYIATAWHNLSGRHSESLRPLSDKGGVPDNVVAIVPQVVSSHVGPGLIRTPFTLPVETDSQTLYLVHPVGWPRIDVAVLPIDPEAVFEQEMHVSNGRDIVMPGRMRNGVNPSGVSTDIQPIQRCAGAHARLTVPPDALVHAGDDLFVLGYPKGIADFSAAPIWKRATVASDPNVGWNRQPKFLIDCASREGMSGAPVIAYHKNGRIHFGTSSVASAGPAALLHGIYVGRIVDNEVSKEDRFFEAQIGTVWKRLVIDEIIDGQVPALHSSLVGAPPKAVDQAVREKWPDDPAYFLKILAVSEYRSGMTQVALEHLNGNADPRLVYEAVIAYARELDSQAKPG